MHKYNIRRDESASDGQENRELRVQLLGFPGERQLLEVLQGDRPQHPYQCPNAEEKVAIKIVELNTLKSKKLE